MDAARAAPLAASDGQGSLSGHILPNWMIREGLYEAAAEINRSYKRARIPASSKAIMGLQEVRAGDARLQAECAVCLQDFDAEDKLRAMPCSHAFHQDCILGWLRVKRVCPLCRHALPTQQQDDDDDDENYQQASMPVPEEA
ncbi:uncharacterized protein LOC133906353 [Phragmites australis]|uniref:uncharacterized protein LOC133906353 n=1 Tax=Phragmites australis TaxID=29695 RepID=UPI002D776B40|nr:uncharacterized protein LOC133906353 [Phragmites australis]